MSKLRDSARWCPYCMSCGLQNPNGDLLCLAHSNRQQDGKGMALKSRDEKGAIVCMKCHDLIDGRVPFLGRDARQALHTVAHEATVRWWIKAGYLTPERGDQLLKEAA